MIHERVGPTDWLSSISWLLPLDHRSEGPLMIFSHSIQRHTRWDLNLLEILLRIGVVCCTGATLHLIEKLGEDMNTFGVRLERYHHPGD